MTDQCLISAAALAARLDDPRLAIVDCRFELAAAGTDTGLGRRLYEAGHLPGAVHAPLEGALSGPPTPDSGRHPLPAAGAFARTLSDLGIDGTTQVVAYDQGHGAGAARLWWLLRAAGHRAVQVLDGGYAAWTQGGHPVSTAAVARRPAQVPARPFAGWVSTAEVLALRAGAAGAGMLLVDARGADRYAGRNETMDPVAGHVPGALNRPFLQNLGPDGRFLPPATLRAAWSTLLGGAEGSRVVAMCGSGITACQNLLALEVAGLPGGRLYAGSWSEWIRDPARLIATGATGAGATGTAS